MSELPQGWAEATLGSLASKIVDGSHNPPPKMDAGKPMLSARNIRDGQIIFDDYRLIEEVAFDGEHRRTRIKQGDVLLTIVGTIGRTAVVQTDASFTLQRSVAVIGDFGEIEPLFLARALESPAYQLWLLENAKGTAQKGVYLKALAASKVPVAPLSEQRRIVAKIDSLVGNSRRARDHLDHIPRLVEKYKQAILAAAFRGDLTREWQSKNSSSAWTQHVAEQLSSGRRWRWLKEARRKAELRRRTTTDEALLKSYEHFDGSEPQPLGAAGWFLVPMGTFAVPLGGKRLPKGAGYVEGKTSYPYIRVTDFTDGKLDPSSCKHLSRSVHEEIAQYCVETGDLCISIAGTIGATFVVPPTANGANLTENAARLIVAEQVLPAYLDLYLKSPEGQAQITTATVATGQPKLALFRIEQLLVPVCSVDEQAELVKKVDAALKWIDRLGSEATSARKLIDRLEQAVFAKAFRGELAPQDPADEPASVLLERIKAERGAVPKITRKRKAKTA